MCFHRLVSELPCRLGELSKASNKSLLHDVNEQNISPRSRGEPCSRTGRPEPPAWASGGASRNRTDDLLLAKQALSQLSYGPLRSCKSSFNTDAVRSLRATSETTTPHHTRQTGMVGLGRLELPTSRLSSARSNQLSYRPDKPSTSMRPVRKRNEDGGVPQYEASTPRLF